MANKDSSETKLAQTTSSKSSGAKSMTDLMAKHTSSFQTFKKGDLIKGKIIKLTKNEILVDIKAKSHAIVLEKDKTMLHSLLDMLHLGDEVEVSVLNPESDMGYPVVSLRRFLSNTSWKSVEEAKAKDEQIEVTISDQTKGGLIVTTANGLVGFLPNSHMSSSDALTSGKRIKVRVIELARKENKIIFSQKLTLSAQEFDNAVKGLKIGDTVEVTIANIAPFGLFVTVVSPVKNQKEKSEIVLDGLIHISEISWDKVEDINQLYNQGQKIEAKIIGFDKETRRIDLSIKKMTEDPFEKLIETYPVDKKVTGEVISVDDTGILVRLADGTEALIRKEKIPPMVTFVEGQTVSATVSEIDKRRHKIYLLPILKEKPLMYR